MNTSKAKHHRELSVQVSFEVSRLSPEYLASAYDVVVPHIRRTPSHRAPASIPRPVRSISSLGDPHHECS